MKHRTADEISGMQVGSRTKDVMLIMIDCLLEMMDYVLNMMDLQAKGGRTWVNSVANSVFALDKRYNPASVHPYLKHAPFVYSIDGTCSFQKTTILYQRSRVHTNEMMILHHKKAARAWERTTGAECHH